MRRHPIVLVIAFVVAAAWTSPGQSQVVYVNRDSIPPVDSMLAMFARYHAARGTPAQRRLGDGGVFGVLAYPDLYGRERVPRILDGLERLATTSENFSVRAAATIWLSAAGDTGEVGTGLDDMSVVGRLRRVFETSANPVEGGILNRMWCQANAAEAARFLAEVAQLNRAIDLDNEFPAPYLAVNSLSKMGDRGAAVLRNLRAADQVKNPRARGLLEYFAQRNFRSW